MWAWESKAVSAALVLLTFLVAAVLFQTSEATLVTRALSARAHFPMPALARFVERLEMSLIVDAIEVGDDFLVVDGGNRVGKSVAVEVAASRLSSSRTVRWSKCKMGGTAVKVLQHLFGLDVSATALARVLSGAAKLSVPEPPSVEDIEEVVLSLNTSGLEPVFVVEMAERLEVKELKALLDFAKELVDKRRGRFIFVFSPTDKLDAIVGFGSLSRAEVIHVGDLSKLETAAFLASTGCDAERTSALYGLIGGHLPHLVMRTVRKFCSGATTLSDVEATLFADIVVRVKAADRVLGIGSACNGLCGVATNTWLKPEVLDVLFQGHLVVATLKELEGFYVDSQVVQAFVNARCACSQ